MFIVVWPMKPIVSQSGPWNPLTIFLNFRKARVTNYMSLLPAIDIFLSSSLQLPRVSDCFTALAVYFTGTT